MSPFTLEDKVKKKIGQFDVISLLRLLQKMGYGPGQIRFRSHESLCSQSRLVQDISFYQERDKKEVEISLAMGLLGPQSPLPSYFRKTLEADISAGISFSEFVGFFDHQLIRDFLCGLYPELARFFQGASTPSLPETLQMFDLRSVSALHVLFSRVFPEAGVEVKEVSLNRRLSASPVCLGQSILGGSAVFGYQTQVPVRGRHITLHCEEEESDRRRPWPQEAKERMERLLFPKLAPLGMELEIDLVLTTQCRWVRLHPKGCLGYDTLKTHHPGPRRVSLFKGQITPGS
ncbi:MAG: type VI secretion system baseplate subunit TssG [Desulfobacterales bacterium]|nr:type VI secretion system baseplate subunit TssG [Desulfobacterales bacterium]